MFNIIEVTTATYNDTSWQMTFYYIATLAFLIGAFWTYYQVFIKSKKKKQPLKENIIYNNTEDVIEESYNNNKNNKSKKYDNKSKDNNYKYNNKSKYKNIKR